MSIIYEAEAEFEKFWGGLIYTDGYSQLKDTFKSGFTSGYIIGSSNHMTTELSKLKEILNANNSKEGD